MKLHAWQDVYSNLSIIKTQYAPKFLETLSLLRAGLSLSRAEDTVNAKHAGLGSCQHPFLTTPQTSHCIPPG